jgi:hypothetical protein
MKHGRKVVICLAGGLVLHTGARGLTADSPGNPYSGIIERNVFALKPPPPPPSDLPPVAPPQKIVLTGIVKAFGKKQVFFKTPMSAKPGEAPKETSFILSEGERAGDIEVLEINERAGTVKFKNHGQPDDRSLEKDGMKPTGGGGPGVLPAVPVAGLQGGGVPGMGVPGGGAALTPVPTLGGGGAATIQRPLRVPTPGVSGPQGFSAPPNIHANPGANTQIQPKTLPPEEQVVLIEINRKLTEAQVANGEAPPLPPTLFAPEPGQ